ncbi:hypothetical protein BJ742DRAFT_404383 [Cladochytrium replicatum]|nr:hypothetical protein BJ742DRAFT_404383 [Cladochytrium replicatum]
MRPSFVVVLLAWTVFAFISEIASVGANAAVLVKRQDGEPIATTTVTTTVSESPQIVTIMQTTPVEVVQTVEVTTTVYVHVTLKPRSNEKGHEHKGQKKR